MILPYGVEFACTKVSYVISSVDPRERVRNPRPRRRGILFFHVYTANQWNRWVIFEKLHHNVEIASGNFRVSIPICTLSCNYNKKKVWLIPRSGTPYTCFLRFINADYVKIINQRTGSRIAIIIQNPITSGFCLGNRSYKNSSNLTS